jgi:hypothetical protein
MKRKTFLSITVGGALLLAGLSLTACKTDQPAPAKPAGLAGTYTLVAIAGHQLPYAPQHEGRPGPQIQSGSMAFKSDGTLVSAMTFAIPSGETRSRDVSGRYRQESSRLNFQWDGAGATSAVVQGDSFIMEMKE